ncbi:MAG: TonB-dependent receptor [Bacteroidales bacterium]|nr:TonB-dependent receptor [Bacteroidales bacterium]
MKKKLFTLLFTATMLLGAVNVFGQGSTTSALNGRVVSGNEALTGATVVAVHTPTGAQYGTIADEKGFYRIPNMAVGGPYTVTISFVGYQTYSQEGIYLSLGQTYKIDADLKASDVQLEDVVVIALANDVFDGNRTGAQTTVGTDQIDVLPTVGRNISDFARLTPQVTVTDLGGMTFAGINNRYNSISIDGAVNNDVFGLSNQGTNGGQTGGTPISMDAIKEFQIVLAPFDVRQGGFAGAGVNAVTRSGSNVFDGSAYYFFRNEDISGRTPTDDPETERKLLEPFTSKTYGARLGGPIIKDKLFFFASAEIQRDNTPQPFDFNTYNGSATTTELDALVTKLNGLGYDPGGFIDNNRELKSDKFLVRLDYNLNRIHKLTLRHSYTKSESFRPSRSTNSSINFYNGGVSFPSVTNSTALELKSNFNKSSNNLIIGYTTVRDDRDPMGSNFPRVQIQNGSGRIYFGSEEYSTANQLDQNVFSITDNFSIYKGRHTITLGTNNEFSHSYNLFIRQNFGKYYYNSLADFMNDASASRYDRYYSLVDNITGDGSKAASEFNMMQLGIYAQDEFEVNSKLKVTYGIRFDLPIFPTKPEEDVSFNTNTIPLLEAAGKDLMGARAGEMPKSQIMFSPRFGFNYDINGDKTFQVRGGIGIFTSRIPLVWPGGAYNNNGLTVGGWSQRSGVIDFRSDWNNQYVREDFGGTIAIPSGQMDLFAEDFKLPQIFRASLAVDKKLPYGIVGTIEGLYSKTLNNIVYYNLNQRNADRRLTNGPDNRPYYGNSAAIDGQYSRIMLGANTNQGYSYEITFQLQKQFDKGLTFSGAYTFGRSMVLNDATSSQNSSQWRYMETVNGLNQLDLSYSDFDRGSRVIGFASYKFDYLNFGSTTISLFYNGQDGKRFSYVYNDNNGRINNERENAGNLIWIPSDQSQINLVDIGNSGDADYVSAAQQWTDLQQFIDDDKYLSKHKGEYAERNGARVPWTNVFDLKIMQDFYIQAGGKKHTLQLSFDIFNVGNLINKDWGRIYYASYDTNTLIDFVGFEADGTTPQFNFEKPRTKFNIDDSGLNSSRWQAQFGVRYIF